MLAGTFQRLLKKLNPHLSIRSNNPAFPAGLYYEDGPNLVHICGVDRNELPEFTVWERDRIVKGGWRRVLKILVAKQIVDRRTVYKVFGCDLSYGHRPKQQRWTDPIQQALKDAQHFGRQRAQAKSKTALADTQDGKPINYYDVDDLLQIHRMKLRQRGEI